MNDSKRTRWTILLLACMAVSFVCVAYPMYVIRPFRAQGARELAVALVVMRFRLVITVISALAALGTAIAYWRVQTKVWLRVLATIAAGLVCVMAVLARVNVFELMFHPVGHPEFAAVNDVKIDNDDKLIVVRINRRARAYPIRTMGYHHIVNDVVDGTAIVATY